jgi:hypothetical protein
MSSGSTPITPKQDLAALLHGYMEIAERMVNPHRIWEPCCGKGAIVNTLRTHGHKVIASDLHDHGASIAPPACYGRDFLLEHKTPTGTECIQTMLLRLAFLESERRAPLLDITASLFAFSFSSVAFR